MILEFQATDMLPRIKQKCTARQLLPVLPSQVDAYYMLNIFNYVVS